MHKTKEGWWQLRYPNGDIYGGYTNRLKAIAGLNDYNRKNGFELVDSTEGANLAR